MYENYIISILCDTYQNSTRFINFLGKYGPLSHFCYIASCYGLAHTLVPTNKLIIFSYSTNIGIINEKCGLFSISHRMWSIFTYVWGKMDFRGVKWTFVISRKTVHFLSYKMHKTNIYTNLQ